jgi:hypothetical protein
MTTTGAPPADHWKVLAGRPELYGATCHEAVAGFEQAALSDDDRHKIAHRNAERILRLT